MRIWASLALMRVVALIKSLLCRLRERELRLVDYLRDSAASEIPRGGTPGVVI